MNKPDDIKKGLACLASDAIDTVKCSFCAYRHDKDCRASIANDAAQYIARLEPLTAIVQSRRGGRIRRVYLYTIRNSEGVICKDATADEAAAAVGYATHHGLESLYRRGVAGGDTHGLEVTRKKGVIGVHCTEERMPYFLHTVKDAEDRVLLENVNAKDVAAHFGISERTLRSVYHEARKRGDTENIVYRGKTIIRQKTERGMNTRLRGDAVYG